MDYEARIVSLEHHFEESDILHKEMIKRLNEKDVSDALVRQQLDTLVVVTSRIENKIDEQQKLPAKRWETVLTSIVTTVVGIVIGALLRNLTL